MSDFDVLFTTVKMQCSQVNSLGTVLSETVTMVLLSVP